eukprot:1547025-Amphidinium_carterae.1
MFDFAHRGKALGPPAAPDERLNLELAFHNHGKFAGCANATFCKLSKSTTHPCEVPFPWCEETRCMAGAITPLLSMRRWLPW